MSYLFHPKSQQQAFSYKVSSDANGKFLLCRFLLCSEKEKNSLCVTGCQQNGRKQSGVSEESLVVGPLIIAATAKQGSCDFICFSPSV